MTNKRLPIFPIRSMSEMVASYPAKKIDQTKGVSPTAARKIFASRKPKAAHVKSRSVKSRFSTRFATASEVVQSPASVSELARALRNDPDLIFYHVYNNIEFHPTYGVQKGSLGCLIDGIGNAWDQCSLLVDLLTEAGFTAKFLFGEIVLSQEQVSAWLGTDSSNIYNAYYLLSQGGIPCEVDYVYPDYTIEISHIWVQVTIDETDYVFDPSFKSYSVSDGIDLAEAMDYDRTTLLSDAVSGATVTADYVQNMNQGNINADLASYATSFIAYLKEYYPTATMTDIIGGRLINQIFTPVRQTSLSYQSGEPEVWDTISSEYKTTLRIQYLDIDETFFSDDLHCSRLTIFFNDSIEPELRLDGTLVATGSTQSLGSYSSAEITVEHPYPVPYYDQTIYQGIYAPFSWGGGTSYLLGALFGPTRSGMVDYHNNVLNVNELAGGSDESEPILGERLSIIWNMYAAEGFVAGDLLGRMSNCIQIAHHLVGMCMFQNPTGYAETALFDVGGSMSVQRSLSSGDAAAFNTTLAMHGYTLEQLSIQQVCGSSDAGSTNRILEVANADGLKIYKGTETNWPSDVVPNLTGYDSGDLDAIYDNYLSYDWFVLIPEQTGQAFGPYEGYGWQLTSSSGGAIGFIYEYYAGGVGEWDWLWKQLQGIKQGLEGDPVGIKTGSFTYKQTSLTVGSTRFPYELPLETFAAPNYQFPYNLSLENSYDSRMRFQGSVVGLGWRHNWQITANENTDGFKGLGSESPIEAAASIVEFFMGLDVLSDSDFPIPNMLTAVLGNSWWCDQMTQNTVLIQLASDLMTFTKLPDGSYNPPYGYGSAWVLEKDTTFSLTSPQQAVFNFNEAGDLETWEFPFGVTIALTYSSGFLSTVDNGMGRSLNFTYTDSLLSSVDDGNGRTIGFAYDSGQLTTITDALTNDVTFTYDEPGRLLSYFLPENPENAMVVNTYDSLDRISSQLNADEDVQSFYIAGWRTEFINARGYSKIFRFDDQGNTVKSIDELGNETDCVWDGLGRLVQKTLPEGNLITFTYDTANNALTETSTPKPGSTLDAIVRTFTWDATYNKLHTLEDGEGYVTTYTYDDDTGNLLLIERPAVGVDVPTLTLTYNSRGQLETFQNEVGMIRKLEYDETTEVLQQITVDYGMGLLNLVTAYGYNDWGDITSIQDPRGNTTTYTFDSKRRLTQVESPAPFNFLTKYTLDKNDNRVKSEKQTDDIDHPWKTYQATYTVSNNLKTLTDPLSNVTTWDYDEVFNLISKTDAETRTISYGYDAQNKLLSITGFDSVAIMILTYSPNGKVIAVQDGLGNITHGTYDGFDRLQTVLYADGSSAQNALYDANNNPLQKITRLGDLISLEYDSFNTLIQKSSANMPPVSYQFDFSGHLLKVSTPFDANDPTSGDWQFTYNSAGRLTSEQAPDGKTVAYELDENFNTTKITYPDSYYVERQYDELNRLTDIRLNGAVDSAVQFGFDSLSRKITVNFDNDTEIAYTYELNDDISSINFTFVGSSVEFDYGFNGAHQPTSHSVSDSAYMWHPPASDTVVYGTANSINQYPSVGGVNYRYDKNGCVVRNGDWIFTFDTENHLLTASNCMGTSYYLYDPLARQYQKQVGCTAKTEIRLQQLAKAR